MQIDRRSAKIYLWLHAGLVAALLLFPLYRALTDHMTALFSGCFLHDHLYLYCPACGGTRALAALLRLDVVSALRFNPFLVLVAVLAVAFDVWALVRLLRAVAIAWVVLDRVGRFDDRLCSLAQLSHDRTRIRSHGRSGKFLASLKMKSLYILFVPTSFFSEGL